MPRGEEVTDAEIAIKNLRSFIAEQCNAMMDFAKAQGAVSVTQQQMQTYVTEAMRPWALVLERVAEAMETHGERLTALEQRPHFQRPNGGR